MPNFGATSHAHLNTCHPAIVGVMQRAILYIDFSILCGVRGKVEQNRLKAEGKSRVSWPHSRHNIDPKKPKSMAFSSRSVAVDIVPYPVDWNNVYGFIWLSQVIKRVAGEQGVELDWGYDLWGWDMPHWQLKEGTYL